MFWFLSIYMIVVQIIHILYIIFVWRSSIYPLSCFREDHPTPLSGTNNYSTQIYPISCQPCYFHAAPFSFTKVILMQTNSARINKRIVNKNMKSIKHSISNNHKTKFDIHHKRISTSCMPRR